MLIAGSRPFISGTQVPASEKKNKRGASIRWLAPVFIVSLIKTIELLRQSLPQKMKKQSH
jgi:hypothetical protein